LSWNSLPEALQVRLMQARVPLDAPQDAPSLQPLWSFLHIAHGQLIPTRAIPTRA